MAKHKRRYQLIQAASLAIFLGLGIAAAPYADAQDAEPVPDFSEPAPENGETPEATPEISEELKAVLDQMDEVIGALDGDAQRTGNSWQFTLQERSILVVTDTSQGRMRVITPIAAVSDLPEGAMERLMQANFDTALDARYAVAQNLVWGAYIHPLDTLTTRDFASGVLQTHALAETFGTTFSSGALNYGGGDSGAILGEQLRELLEQLEDRNTI